MLIIITMLRQASSSVDAAQATALDRYGTAVLQHATEVERVQVDAIVHDSVLTTLLSAARARTPEAKALAATMAGNAIGHLRDAAAATPDDGSTVRFTTLAQRLADTAAEFARPIEVRTRALGTRTLPTAAAETMIGAAVQAMMNSITHGGEGEVPRWIAVRGLQPDGLEIVIGDAGAGFDIASVPTERLGVRVSILERVANAGGQAVIQSSPGDGTIITLRWPRPEADG